LLPIIGHHSGNQHNTIISSTIYKQEFFNRIGRKPTGKSDDTRRSERLVLVRADDKQRGLEIAAPNRPVPAQKPPLS
jgi:hypothetical protein